MMATVQDENRLRWVECYKGIRDYVRRSYEKNITTLDLPHKHYIHMESGAYWDNYFNVAGVLIYEHDPLFLRMAREATENLLHIVRVRGFVPNIYGIDWGENRSQPPVLSLMVRDVYERCGVDQTWLRNAYETLTTEYRFWTDSSPTAIEDHTTAVPGLLRYSSHGPDDAPGPFLLSELRKRIGLVPTDAEDKKRILRHYYAEAASGMDFTTRFEGRCADFAALDLNCYLWAYEKNFAFFVRELGLRGEPDWDRLAADRRTLIRNYFWNDTRGLYLDYDTVNGRHSRVASLASFVPLFLGLAGWDEARRAVENLRLFECQRGLSNVEETPDGRRYQWGWPMGWGVGHFWVFVGLYRYGFVRELHRLCGKWLDLCAKNYVEPDPPSRPKHRLYEKYDVETGRIEFREYESAEYLSFTLAPYNWAYRYMTEGHPHYWDDVEGRGPE